MRGCTLHVACPPLVQACDPQRTDGFEAPCTRMCHLMWPRRELMGPSTPHDCGFCGSKPVRVGAAPKAPQKAQNLQILGSPCGVAGSQRRRYAPICGVQCGLERRHTLADPPSLRDFCTFSPGVAKNRSNGIRIPSPSPPLPAVLLHDMHAHASACAHAHEHGPVAPILSRL